MKVPTGIMRSKMTGRHHPILFRNPAKTTPEGEDLQRYQSFSHHVEGFDTVIEAEAWIARHNNLRDMGLRWEWEGRTVGITPVINYWWRRSDIEAPVAVYDEEGLELESQVA